MWHQNQFCPDKQTISQQKEFMSTLTGLPATNEHWYERHSQNVVISVQCDWLSFDNIILTLN